MFNKVGAAIKNSNIKNPNSITETHSIISNMNADFINIDVFDDIDYKIIIEDTLKYYLLPLNINIFTKDPILDINNIKDIFITNNQPNNKHYIAVNSSDIDIIKAIIDVSCTAGIILDISEMPNIDKCSIAEFIIVLTAKIDPILHKKESDFLPTQLSMVSIAKDLFPEIPVGVYGAVGTKKSEAAIKSGADFFIKDIINNSNI